MRSTKYLFLKDCLSDIDEDVENQHHVNLFELEVAAILINGVAHYHSKWSGVFQRWQT